MTREFVIQFTGQPGAYTVELFELTIAVGMLQPLGGPKPLAFNPTDPTFQNALAPNTPVPALDKAGLELFQPLDAALGQSLQQALAGKEARIYLDIRADALQRLPWEILKWRKDLGGGSADMLVRRAHSLNRVRQPDWGDVKRDVEGPLRVLIVVGSTPDDPAVQAEQEEQWIRRRVQPVARTIDIEVIERPLTQQVLYDRIKEFRPHVLHFIGHGLSDRLEFGSWDWQLSDLAADIGGRLLDQWVPNLAFLNACRSGAASGQLATLADAFLAQGAFATVAMQGSIAGEAAGILAGAFYENLAAGVPIDEALRVARGEVANTLRNEKEASYPALTLRTRPEAVLPKFLPVTPDYIKRAKLCEILPKLQSFVNQVTPRREICRSLWPLPGKDREQLILVRGPSGFGKTVLAGWLLDLAVRQGHRGRYIKIGAEQAGVDEVGVLDLIWGDSKPAVVSASPLFDALPLQPADKLRQALDAASKTKGEIGNVYALFRRALSEVSSQQPVTIVLDDFGRRMQAGSFWYLWENLVVPLFNDRISNVCIVVAMSEDDVGYYDIHNELKTRAGLKVPMVEIPLAPLELDEFMRCFKSYMYFAHATFRSWKESEITGILGPMEADLKKRPQTLSVGQIVQRATWAAQLYGM
jgi:hypothetical protein